MDSETVQTEQNDGESALEICRLCMSTESLEDVFEVEGLRSWISDYLSIMVSSADNISHAICTICRIRLDEFHQFRTRCQEVQATLWSMVRTEETVETPKVIHPSGGANKGRDAPITGVLQIGGQYHCGICWKVFAERKQILDHRRIHGPKKHACMYCGNSYPIRRYLVLHLRSHKHDRLEQESTEKKEIACGVKNVPHEEIDSLEHETISEERSSYLQGERKEEGSLNEAQTETTNIESTDNRIEIGHVKIEELSDNNTETETAVSENDEFEPYADQFNLYSAFHQKNVKREIIRSKDSMNTEVEEVYDGNGGITDERKSTGNFEESSSRTDELMVNTQLIQAHQCNECGKVFTTKQKAKDHLRLVHGEKKHICPTCGKGYVLANQLRIHVQTHDSATPFKCNMCVKSFKREKSLWHHNSTQHSLQQNCCIECGRQFAKRQQLDKHLRSTLHRRNVKKNENQFKVKNYHYRKIKTAEVEALLTDEGVYQCDICPKRFMEQQQIRDHKRLVHGERKLACPFCDKRYNIPSQFRVHVRTHEKPYRCDVCAKSFKRERTLWFHNRAEHSSEK